MPTSDEIIRFLGYSVIWLPLITLMSWGVFRLLPRKRTSGIQRFALVVVSCVVVVVAVVYFQVIGRGEGFVLDNTHFYEMIDAAIAVLIGLVFWGKPQKKT